MERAARDLPGEVQGGLDDLVRAVQRHRRDARRRSALLNGIRWILRDGRHGLANLTRGGVTRVAQRWRALRSRLLR